MTLHITLNFNLEELTKTLLIENYSLYFDLTTIFPR